MGPFLQFRLWMRDGPLGERVIGATGAAVLVGLIVLAAIPVREPSGGEVAAVTGVAGTDGGASTATGPQRAGSTTATGSAAGSAVGPAGGSSADRSTGGEASAGAGSASASGPCSGLTASARGITPTEVRIDVSLVYLAGPVGNATFHIREDSRNIVDAIVAEINETGGLACGRKLVVKKYDVNPIDPTDGQSKCLQIQQDQPFLDLDFAGYVTPASRSCFEQAKLLFKTGTSIGETELKSAYPYAYSSMATSEKQVRDMVLGLNERGYFAPPKFQKVGIFTDKCDPNVTAEMEADLAKAGVKPSQISKFELECELVAPPNEISQAVLQHKIDNVSNVLLAASISNSQNYVRIAAQQGFRPVYGVTDYGSNMAAPTASTWDPAFDGAVGITSTRSGDLNSGMRSAEVEWCNKALVNHNVPGIRTELDDGTALTACDGFSLFRTVMDKLGANPTQSGFIQTLARIGLWKSSIDGDSLWDRPGKATGGDFHRAISWRADCTCWKVIDPVFKPGH